MVVVQYNQRLIEANFTKEILSYFMPGSHGRICSKNMQPELPGIPRKFAEVSFELACNIFDDDMPLWCIANLFCM